MSIRLKLKEFRNYEDYELCSICPYLAYSNHVKRSKERHKKKTSISLNFSGNSLYAELLSRSFKTSPTQNRKYELNKKSPKNAMKTIDAIKMPISPHPTEQTEKQAQRKSKSSLSKNIYLPFISTKNNFNNAETKSPAKERYKLPTFQSINSKLSTLKYAKVKNLLGYQAENSVRNSRQNYSFNSAGISPNHQDNFKDENIRQKPIKFTRLKPLEKFSITSKKNIQNVTPEINLRKDKLEAIDQLLKPSENNAHGFTPKPEIIIKKPEKITLKRLVHNSKVKNANQVIIHSFIKNFDYPINFEQQPFLPSPFLDFKFKRQSPIKSTVNNKAE